MTENDTTPEDLFIIYYNKLIKFNFKNKAAIKRHIIDVNLTEYEKLYNELTTINWESDAAIEKAFETSSLMIVTINYEWLMQLIKLEQAEDYENAKILYDIIYQSYYLIAQEMYQNFDPEFEPEQIKNNIMDGAQHMRETLKILEQ